jgi:hypothetical protein
MYGGEPLLAGTFRLSEIALQFRVAITSACMLDLRIHTNGVRLDADLCEIFRAERVNAVSPLTATGLPGLRRRLGLDGIIFRASVQVTWRPYSCHRCPLCQTRVRQDEPVNISA